MSKQTYYLNEKSHHLIYTQSISYFKSLIKRFSHISQVITPGFYTVIAAEHHHCSFNDKKRKRNASSQHVEMLTPAADLSGPSFLIFILGLYSCLLSKGLWLSGAFYATPVEAIIESTSISGLVSGVPANQITLIHYLHPFRHSTIIILLFLSFPCRSHPRHVPFRLFFLFNFKTLYVPLKSIICPASLLLIACNPNTPYSLKSFSYCHFC